MKLATIVGSLAGAATSTSLLPQLIKAWKTRSVKDLSFSMIVMLAVGLFLWVIYGFMVGAWPIIVTNAFTLIQTVVLAGIKIQSDRRQF